MSRQLLFTIFAGLSVITSPASAQERFTHVWGGKGGKQFVLRCPVGSVLTGVSALAGAYVNNIAPICDGYRMPGTGGGGDRSTVVCPSNSVVRKMQVISLRSENLLVKALKLYCFSKVDGAATAEVPLNTPGRYTGFYPTDHVDCGSRNAIGLQGRSGASVDAVGLICAGKR